MTVILYLIARPGVGKYTIAKEIAKAGYAICDNQLINNPIFTLLNYNGYTEIPEYAWESIRLIRENVLNFMSVEINNNYILTNVLGEIEGDHEIFNQVQEMALKRGSVFVPVKLLISEEEHVKRVTEPGRRLRYKSIDPNEAYLKYSLIQISHPNLLELDVTNLSANDAAKKILEHLRKINDE